MSVPIEVKQRLWDLMRSRSHKEAGDLLKKFPAKNLVAWLNNYIDEHCYTQAKAFDFAGISRKYGYKLLTGERKFASRDMLLRFCLAVHMKREDLDKALQLAGMNPLDEESARDLVISVGADHGSSLGIIMSTLTDCGLEPLGRDSP